MQLESFEVYSIFFMIILFVWSFVWIVLSLFKVRQNEHKLFWLVNLFWNIVNIFISLFSLVQIGARQVLTYEEAQQLITIVGVNIFLDIGYIVIALLLLNNSSSSKKQVGSALFIQGTFLLLLDVAIVLVLKPLI